MFVSRGSLCVLCFFFFKQKTAYEMRISDWSSDVCSSDLGPDGGAGIEIEGKLHVFIRVVEDIAGQHDTRIVEFGALKEFIVPDIFWLVGVADKRGIIGEIGRASCRERVCQYV